MNVFSCIVRIFSDTIAYYLSIAIAIALSEMHYGDFLGRISELDPGLILGGNILFIFCIYNYNGYKHYMEFSSLSEITSLWKGITFMLVLSAVTIFLFKIPVPDYFTVPARLGLVSALYFLPPAGRVINKKILNFLFGYNYSENTVVYGTGEMGNKFIANIQNIPNPRFKIVGVINDDPEEYNDPPGFPFLGTISDINQIVNKYSVKRIIVAIAHLTQKQIESLVLKANHLGVRISFIPSTESFTMYPTKLRDYSGVTMLSTRQKQPTLYYTLIKRILDIILSIVGLILALPILLVVSFILKLDSPGPIIFKQERVGLKGRKFQMYKLRSMYVDTPKYAHCPTSGDDPRITKVGKWLRRLSIDELPQLINVLKGDMSIVGPRPEMPFIVDQYSELEKRRLNVKPGLTGLWQISAGRNSEISHNLEYDFYYIENQSLTLDFVIMILTVIFVFRGATH